MEYSFECGACHAIYKLDEDQISQKGVKITCPKCLSYFILRKGFTEGPTLEAAYIEYIVQDGPQETTKAPPPVRSDFDSSAKTEKIISGEKTEKIQLKADSSSFRSARTKAQTKKEASFVGPYPTAKDKKDRKAIPYIMIILLVVAIFWTLWKIL